MFRYEQQSLFENDEACTATAVADAPVRGAASARGAVFTRDDVVDYILDLVGYTTDKPLYQLTVVEPSFGGGSFVFAVVRRLLQSWKRDVPSGNVGVLKNCLFAVELHRETFDDTSAQLVDMLVEFGIAPSEARGLADDWLLHGDYLLDMPQHRRFDFVVGNPPYVRHEEIDPSNLAEYRAMYRTMVGRADLYVAFIEKSLGLLGDTGVLGFICSDRWLKNAYGQALRKLVAEQYSLVAYADMTQVDAFTTKVATYPAIFAISKRRNLATQCCEYPTPIKTVANVGAHGKSSVVVASGGAPWLLGCATETRLIRRLEAEYPRIEDMGCKIGIGVATGADRVYIAPWDALDIEDDRKLALVRTQDIESGEVAWRGDAVANPYDALGQLVDLELYPQLKQYLLRHEEVLRGRHCAKKTPTNWFRTIDKINPALAAVEKLLIPDIKNRPHVVYENGVLYPHHNLYYVTAQTWNLRALQAVLLSDLVKISVAAYCTKIRGGYCRFQAQYLRQLRLPEWHLVGEDLRAALAAAGQSRNIDRCNALVAKLYNMNPQERQLLAKSRG